MSTPFDEPPRLSDRRGAPPTTPVSRVTVGVDNGRCHLYAICQQEAPDVFEVRNDRRLVVDGHPPAEALGRVLRAARHCPMQAIDVEVRR